MGLALLRRILTLMVLLIPVDDVVQGERVFVYDPNKPFMDIGMIYCMTEFRSAMRQFAINEEF
jgi:hypothetical protein